MLLGNLLYLTALLPVEEHRFQWRRLSINERSADALTQGGVGEVGRAAKKLFILFGGLNVTCRRTKRKTRSLNDGGKRTNVENKIPKFSFRELQVWCRRHTVNPLQVTSELILSALQVGCEQVNLSGVQ